VTAKYGTWAVFSSTSNATRADARPRRLRELLLLCELLLVLPCSLPDPLPLPAELVTDGLGTAVTRDESPALEDNGLGADSEEPGAGNAISVCMPLSTMIATWLGVVAGVLQEVKVFEEAGRCPSLPTNV